MQTRDIRDLVRFDENAVRTEVLLESKRLWSQVVCLQHAQGLGPIRDEASDAIVAVLTGEVAAQVGSGRARMKQWESVLVSAGEELVVHNASAEPTVLLFVVGPPPAGD